MVEFLILALACAIVMVAIICWPRQIRAVDIVVEESPFLNGVVVTEKRVGKPGDRPPTTF